MITKNGVAVVLSVLAVTVGILLWASYSPFVVAVLCWLIAVLGYGTLVEFVINGLRKRFGHGEKDEETSCNQSAKIMFWQFVYTMWFKYFVPGSAKEMMDQWLGYELGSQLVSTVSTCLDPWLPCDAPAEYTSIFPVDFPLHQAHMDLLVYFVLPQLAILVLAFIPSKAWAKVGRKIIRSAKMLHQRRT